MYRCEKGSMLLVVIVAIVIFSALAAGVAAMISSGVRGSADHSLSIRAMYLAESGAEYARGELRGSGDWLDSCSHQIGGETVPLGRGYFKIMSSEVNMIEDNPSGCRISVLGWVGDDDYENALASRRIRSTIPVGFIQNRNGADNIFADENNWNNLCGPHRDCDEDGSIEFHGPGNNQDDTLQRSAASGPLVSDTFDEDDTIYLALQLGNDDYDNLVDFGLEKLPGNIDRSWASHSVEAFGNYHAVVELGNGFTPEEINDQAQMKFFIEWLGESITIQNGCLGTESYCTADFSSVGDDWEEG